MTQKPVLRVEAGARALRMLVKICVVGQKGQVRVCKALVCGRGSLARRSGRDGYVTGEFKMAERSREINSSGTSHPLKLRTRTRTNTNPYATKAKIRYPTSSNSQGAADPAEDDVFENENITNPDRAFASSYL